MQIKLANEKTQVNKVILNTGWYVYASTDKLSQLTNTLQAWTN